MKRWFVYSVLIGFAPMIVDAQNVVWPYDEPYLTPEQVSAGDSSKTEFLSRQSLYINTFTNKDSISILQVGRASKIQQSIFYDLNYNTVAHAKNEYFDVSGFAQKDNVFFPGITLGFDWTPILIFNSNSFNQAVLGSLDLGPVARTRLWGCPLTLRGGYAGKRWSDSLPVGKIINHMNSALQSDNGYYGAFDIGDGTAPIPFVPVRMAVKGYGRNMETSKMIAGIASLSMTRQVPTGDSIFVGYNDSLIDGRDARLSEASAGKARYINDSRRIEHSYQLYGGVKGKYRFFLQPAIGFSFSQYQVEFPNNNILTSDRKNTETGMILQLQTDTSARLKYRGALRIDWEKEEKLGGKSIDMRKNSDNSNLDSLRVALNNYNGYKAVMEQGISVYFPSGIGLQYTFGISRYSQTYPLFYMDGSSTIRNFDDNDWIVQKHFVEATVFSSKKAKILTSGEYSSNLRYYLREERSAENATDQLFRVGLSLIYAPMEKVRFEEDVQAESKQTAYAFPKVQAKNLNFAPYSRRFLSKFGAHWNLFRSDTIHAVWNEIYTDQGYWYNSAYVDSIGIDQNLSYYAVLNKTWDHSLTLTGTHYFNNGINVAAGGSLQGIYALDYKSRAYRPNTFMTKQVIVPFLALASRLNDHIRLDGKVRRYIDTITDDYWDFTIFLSIGF